MFDEPPSARPAPVCSIAANFIEALLGRSDHPIRLRLIHDSERGGPAPEIAGSIGAIWSDVVNYQAQGYGVFFFVNEVPLDTTAAGGSGTSDSDVTAIRALVTDHDVRLPEDWEWHLQPGIIVRTSTTGSGNDELQKGHAYWLVRDCPTDQFKQAQKRIAAYYNSDPQICNPSRVLRLPGTIHQKNPARPCLVTFQACSDGDAKPFAVSEILQGLTHLEVTEKSAPSASSGAPVDINYLRCLLGYIDPNSERLTWLTTIAAIRATPIDGDENEEARRQVAHEFSRGELDRLRRYQSGPPSRYTGEDDVDQAFDTLPPRVGGITFGTLYYAAKAGGYSGPPPVSRHLTGEAVFGPILMPSNGDGSPKPGAFLFTEAEVLEWPDPEELIQGFLMKGENVCIYGPPKVGKTFIALDIALSLAAGLPVFGHLPVNACGAVVYLSGEGHAGMKRRIRSYRRSRGLPDDRALPFYYKSAVPQTKAGMAECRHYVEGILRSVGSQPVLVVIDTMARSMSGLSENEAGDAGRYLELTEGLRTGLGCTVLTLAHSGKNAQQGIRGSSAFVAGFDAVWVAEMNSANRTVKLEAEWLKDSENLGPFCFRLRHVTVPGMTLGQGAALEYVPLTEFKKPDQTERERQRASVHDDLFAHSVIGSDKGLSTRTFAELRVGPPPRSSDSKAVQIWETAVVKMVSHLDNNSRSGTADRRPLYEGYFDGVVLPGGTRLVKRWFLPEISESND